MTQNQYKFVVLNPSDNVAVALEEIPADETIYLSNGTNITIKSLIEFGHKFSIKKMSKGDTVIKYGEVIGRSSQLIEVGEHVHVHNVEGNRGRGDQK